jgi:hypothetical protein
VTRPDARASQLAVILEGQGAAMRNLTRQAENIALADTRNFTRWDDPAARARWASSLAKGIQAVQRQAAAVTNAYLQRTATLSLGKQPPVVPIVSITALRAGVELADVYQRVGAAFRFNTWRGEGFLARAAMRADEAITQLLAPIEAVLFEGVTERRPVSGLDAALDRAASLARTDVTMAMRAQAHQYMTKVKPTPLGWRRMIHPELSAGGTCGLCLAVADRVYQKSDLMPLHDRCHCLPVPVFEGDNHVDTITRDDLQRVYKEAGGTAGALLKRTRYQVNEHGEIGPVLTKRKDKFRNKRDVKADQAVDKTGTRQALALMEKTLPDLRQRAQNDPALRGLLTWTEGRIDSLRSDLERVA